MLGEQVLAFRLPSWETPDEHIHATRKCLLLTHSATLFTIFEADVTASSLRATRQLVTGLIGRELRREDLPALRSVTWSS